MWLRLAVEGKEVRVEVEDKGRGFDPGAVAAGGNGLGNMKSRLIESGGRMEIESKLGQGTRIRFVFGLPEPDSAFPAL
jgi:signal transduction histidine kinase